MGPGIHEHPLTLKEEKKKDGPPKKFCNGCLEPVLGPYYTCPECNEDFDGYSLIIHKKCAELPREIHHPIHPIHPLILTAEDWPFHHGSKCGVCSLLYPEGFFLAYYCSACNFWIDIKCAFKWQNDGHEHKFTFLRRPNKFTCDVCGHGDDNLNYQFYICKICQLTVHRQCSWLPLRVKIKRHQHRLKLTWWFQDKYPEYQVFCDICSENMDKNRAMYCCHDHECIGYTAHCECIGEEGRIRNILVHGNDDDEPSTFRLPPANETTADDKALQIGHFSHQHKLTLIDGQEVARQDDQDEGITCNGCTLPIMRGESYRSCTEQEGITCNFSLHITCAKLPRTKLLPLHPHELTLLKTGSFVGGMFKCDMCQTLSQGFSYNCGRCGFHLDLYCCNLYECKSHRCDAHVHTLQFSRELVLCSSCGAGSKNFCFRCHHKMCNNFQLCIPCVKLPRTVRYKYDNHPLKLTYTSVKNDLDEYYCDICEGKRDPKHWFYSCPDCDFDCHPHCIRGRYPQVKLGGSYKHSDHQHNVALVDKRKSEIRNDRRERFIDCPKCEKICGGLVYECLECGINMHLDHHWSGRPINY